MKTARRHELQTNTLADWLGKEYETVRPYAKTLLGIVLAAVVLVAFYLVSTRRSADVEAREWTRYFTALDSENPEDLDDLAQAADLKGTPVGYWANLIVADRAFSQGSSQLFEDRTKANEELSKAVTHYKEAVGGSDPLLRQRALFGLGRSYESQSGKLQDARAQYERLIKEFPDSVYGGLAKKRLADIDRGSTKEFYDWFAEAKLPAPPGSEGGVPGEKPPFSLEGIDDLKLPESLHEPLLGPANAPGSSPAGIEGDGASDVPNGQAAPVDAEIEGDAPLDDLLPPDETDLAPEEEPAEEDEAPGGATDTPTSP
jgi:tetratricopeptide (TPR) repeat protein